MSRWIIYLLLITPFQCSGYSLRGLYSDGETRSPVPSMAPSLVEESSPPTLLPSFTPTVTIANDDILYNDELDVFNSSQEEDSPLGEEEDETEVVWTVGWIIPFVAVSCIIWAIEGKNRRVCFPCIDSRVPREIVVSRVEDSFLDENASVVEMTDMKAPDLDYVQME